MEVFRQFTFDAAHRLDHLPEAHKCGRVHGHTYRLIVRAEGPVAAPVGWVIDFAELKAKVHAVIDQLDHRLLNDIQGLEQPTTEHLAAWIWDRLHPTLPELTMLELWENANSGVRYTGPAAIGDDT
ncbi:MAG: 6-carboxytetrahydropterin synthase QueD [Planctomycetota bacterium]